MGGLGGGLQGFSLPLFNGISSDPRPLATFFSLLLTLVYCHRAHHTSAVGKWWHLICPVSCIEEQCGTLAWIHGLICSAFQR